MSIIIKTMSNGTDLTFNTDNGAFNFNGKDTNAYANVDNLRDDAKVINGQMITHRLLLNYKDSIGLTADQAKLAQSAIDDYRSAQRKLYAASNAKKIALNLLMSEGHDDGRYNLSADEDHICPGA